MASATPYADRYRIPQDVQGWFRQILSLTKDSPEPKEVYRLYADTTFALERLQIPGKQLNPKECVMLAAAAGLLPPMPAPMDPAHPLQQVPDPEAKTDTKKAALAGAK